MTAQRRGRMRTGHRHFAPAKHVLMKARRLPKCSRRALACCRHRNCRRLPTARSDAFGLVCALLEPALPAPAFGATAGAGVALVAAGGCV